MLFLLALACAPTTQTDEILALDGDSEAGATAFADNCAGCHAEDGSGGSGPALVGEADEGEAFVDIVLEGKADMPSFADVLSNQDIADVLAFVQSL
ncbi:MAG: cytochrome c [Deltaproteobacteria bacterium]|nr:cytochrome c [Deltaproteobacteria bacterium]